MPICVAMIEYDGTNYSGWQRQANAPSIQEELEKALAIACGQPRVAVTGSGRTDAGVHARGQVAHFALSHEQLHSLRKLQKSLNGLLPGDIAVVDCALGQNGFHARFDARARRYHYYVSLGPIALDRRFRTRLNCAPDLDQMNAAARLLIGQRHFGAFCRTQSLTSNRVCNVTHAQWVPEHGRDHWRFEIVADRFLHGMVRAIVGTLLEVGTGKRTVGSVLETLSSQDRRSAGPAAAARGLVLEQVVYDAPLFSGEAIQ